jgi:hypothetical protein
MFLSPQILVRRPPAAAGGAVVTTTWDTATFGPNFAFSNSNQDATKLSASSGWSSIRANVGKNSGKLYYEEKITGPGIDFGYVGIMDVGTNLSFNIGADAGHDSFGKDWRSGNVIDVTGAFTLQASTLAPGLSVNDVIGFAVDFTAGKIWMAQNNNWSSVKISEAVEFESETAIR